MNNTEQADMDSSSPFRLRTAIVVASMVALPVIAICGVKLPKYFAWGKSESSSAAISPPATSRPGVSVSNGVPPGPSGAYPAGSIQGEAHTQADPRVFAAGGNAAATFDPNTASFPVIQTGNSDVRAWEDSVMGATGTTEPGRIYPLPSPEAEPAERMPPPVVVAEQFSTIQQRLRAMGATHYALETWGPRGDMYRFQCRMSAGQHPGYTRQFEAIDDDALRVMQTVLEEIDAWKSGRLP
jgi:hypothetical protein